MRQLGRIYNTARRYQPGGEAEEPEDNGGFANTLNPGFTPKVNWPYDVDYGYGRTFSYPSSYPRTYPEDLYKASQSGEYSPEEINAAKEDFLNSEEGRNYENERRIAAFENRPEGGIPVSNLNRNILKPDDYLERPRKERIKSMLDEYPELLTEHYWNNREEADASDVEEEEVPMLGKEAIYDLWKESKGKPGFDKSVIDNYKKRWLESEEGKKWKDDYRQGTKRLMSQRGEPDFSAFEAEPYEVTPEGVADVFGLAPYEDVDMSAYAREVPDEEEFDEDLGVTNYNDLYNNASRKDLRKLAHGKGWQNAEGRSLVGVDDRRTGRQYARSVRRGRREDLRNGAKGNPYRNQAEVDEAIRERRGRYGKGGSLVRYYLSVLGR